MNIDINDLAAEITRKIRDEIESIKFINYGEIKEISDLANGGKRARVQYAGSDTTSIFLNCISNYEPSLGDWVMILSPPGSDDVIIGEVPAKENTIIKLSEKYASLGDPIQKSPGQFYNSWINYGGGFKDANYSKDDFNTVHLSGLIKQGTDQHAFTLETGYRPNSTLLFVAISSNGGVRVDVRSDGRVMINESTIPSYVSLDGISFKAEQ